MRHVIDLDYLQLIAAPGDRRQVLTVQYKRGDGVPFEVQFVRNGVPEALPDSAVLTFMVKVDGEYDGPALVAFSDFTGPAEGSLIYSGSPSFNTEALNAELGVDGSPGNDKRFIDAMAEFSWVVSDGPPTSTTTFTARVNNDVIRGDEDTPTSNPSPDDYVAARAVLHDRPQELTPSRIAQALSNLGITVNADGELTITTSDGVFRLYCDKIS